VSRTAAAVRQADLLVANLYDELAPAGAPAREVLVARQDEDT